VAIRPDAVQLIQVAQAVQPQPQWVQPQIAPGQMYQPLLIHAGDYVKLWMQDKTVRIELSGVAEQSAHNGERVIVRILQQTEDAGQTVQRIAGIVRGTGDVEMER
jgi:flagella basal body P-ring formation protein FlgA